MKVRLLFFIFCTLAVQIASADHPKYEFRATWLAMVLIGLNHTM